MNLRITGPSPLPPEVREAAARQMVSHRGEAFRSCVREVLPALAALFGTRQTPLLFTASGTGGLEAAVVNTLAPGARVLAVSIGHFGDRFAEIAAHFGAEVQSCVFPPGRAADPAEVGARLRKMGGADAVLITHNETSTGVINPLPDLCAEIRRQSKALILVDAVSSLGATPLDMDRLGVDVAVSASQKALMCPPGLALIAASPAALKAAERRDKPCFYFDFTRMRAAVEEGSTTYTPAVSAVFGLQAALGLIRKEGLEKVFERHRRLSRLCRAELAALGLRPFAPEAAASPTVTAMLLPEGRSAGEVRRALEAEHGVFIAQGRKELKERLLRVGHMGWVSDDEVVAAARALGKVLAA